MSKTQHPIYLKDYTKPDFTISEVFLEFELFEDKTIVKSRLYVEKQNMQADDLYLDSLDLELCSLSVDGEVLEKQRYIQEEEQLVIKDVAAACCVEIQNIIYPQKNTELEGLYKSGDIFCTQCEPEGFRRITPFLDRPDVMSIYTVSVIADKTHYPVLLSNGNKQQCYDSFDGRHGVTWHDPHPKPSYLFALVAGDLGVISDSFQTMNNKTVALNIYCDKGNEHKCHHAMSSLKHAMQWDEEKYDREYDLDIYNIVAVDSFNMGAMENKGLNIFNSAYVLADVETASDANFMGVESVIAHEYFHNWTGNRITCRDWFQLTLKEGLTVFRDQCFSADMNSPAVQRIEDVKALRERQFVEDASPTRHPIQPKSYLSMNNFYTATVYEKGAEVIRMLYVMLGEANYRKAMDLYFQTFDAMAVTVDDFLWAMHQYGDFDFNLFKRWYDQSGTPTLEVNESFHEGTYTLHLKQKVPKTLDNKEQKPLYFPLKIALYDKNGEQKLETTLIISKEEESFYFDGYNTQPVLSINRDFSAPIIVQHAASNYPFLMRYDTNSFTRYEASQNFGLQTIQTIMNTQEVDASYIEAYGKILDTQTDLFYKALLLELPSVSAIMQQQHSVDFEVIYDAKKRLSETLAHTYKDELLHLYHTHHHPQDTSIEAASMAQRAIKNRVLKILSALGEETIAYLAKKQYQEASTMTDKITALDIMEHYDSAFAKGCLDDFYECYKNETLVMNKYFAILASVDKTDVLESIEELERNEVYDEKVPNLVRALIGSFTRNYKHFHAKDARGYQFVADKIIALDKINPQIASSLAGAFKIYDKMNPKNKKLMEEALKRVVSTHSLSKNTFEIVSKILKSY